MPAKGTSKTHRWLGQKFGMLFVDDIVGERGTFFAICRCDCGNTKKVVVYNLTSKSNKSRVRSCGCWGKMRQQIFGKHGTTHGKSWMPEFRCWKNMRLRCNSPKSFGYYRYGGRGIFVCDAWNLSFDEFLKDMGPMTAPNYTVERRNVNRGYCPENCYWAPKSEQPYNKENSRRTIDGASYAKIFRDNGLAYRPSVYSYPLTEKQVIDFCKNSPPRTRVELWFRENRGVEISLRPKETHATI